MTEDSRLSDYWLQRTKSQPCRAHVTPRMTLFTPVRSPVDLAMLAPCREVHKSYLNGSASTLCDTWFVSSKGRDSEECTGETRLGSKDVCVFFSINEIRKLNIFQVAPDVCLVAEAGCRRRA